MRAVTPEARHTRRRSSERPSLGIYGGSGAEFFAQVRSQGEARLGIQMSSPCFAFTDFEAESGAAQHARDVDLMARTGAVAAQRRGAWNGTADRHIAGQSFALREIAAGEHCARFRRASYEGIEESSHPSSIGPAGHAERDEAESWRSHPLRRCR